MGEQEEKKPEETKKEEPPKSESPPPETKSDETKEKPPQEIILRVYMHCEGCARKVRRSLKGFEGVEAVITDCRTSKVVVKGEKADPVKVLGRIQRKSHLQMELISPIPKPPSEDHTKNEKQVAKVEEKKLEIPVIEVVLKVYMHCEACALEIEKRIRRMKGVESADADLKNSCVTVKGGFESEKLVEYVYRRTGKQAVIVKIESEKQDEEKKIETEKKSEEGDAKKGEEGKEDTGKPEPESPAAAAAAAAAAVEESKVELKKNEFQYYIPPNYYQVHPPGAAVQEYFTNPQILSPQIFSDENPNACSVM